MQWTSLPTSNVYSSSSILYCVTCWRLYRLHLGFPPTLLLHWVFALCGRRTGQILSNRGTWTTVGERETWGRVAPCHLNKYWFHCQRHTEMTRHGLMFPANRSRRLTSPGYVTAHSSFAWRRRPSHTIARICNRRPRGLIDLLHQINASALGPISHSSTKQRQGCKMWAKRPDTG